MRTLQSGSVPPGTAWTLRVCSDCGNRRLMPVSSGVCMRCAEGRPSRTGGTISLPSLQAARQRSGFTPAELAGRAELAAGTIHGLERGAWKARGDTAERLANALRVEVDDLAKEKRRSA